MSLLKKIALVAFCVLFAVGSAQAGMLDDLRGYWSFDNTINDSSPTGATGTWASNSNPNPTYDTGKFGQSGVFVGTAYDHVVVNAPLGENYYDPGQAYWTSNAITVSLWFKPSGSTLGTSNWPVMIGKGGAQNTWRAAGSGPNIDWIGGNGSMPINPLGQGINMFDGNWHHFVATSCYDANIGPGVQHERLYLDGVLLWPRDYNYYPQGWADTAFDLWIGGNPDDAGRYFAGRLDDIGLWGRVLDASEVAQLWANGAGKSIGSCVPEPSSMVLLAACLLGLLSYAWRKRK